MEDPHDAFLTDLANWIGEYQTPSMEIMICLDANKRWTDNAGISKFANLFDLYNINKEMNLAPTHPNVANLSRSSTIDFCLCSANVLSNINWGTSTPYDLDVLGDHRGFIIDVNL